jgi:hypothetical protein
MTRLFSQIPALDPVESMDFLLPFTLLPESQKDKIRATIEKKREYLKESAQVQAMEKLKQEAQDMLTRRKLKEQLLQEDKFKTRDDARKQIKDKIADDKLMNEIQSGGIN